ncbi:hypothetical protein AJ79_06417 [Helicocarpus griseus UAMH5409]|uniref:Uncharacterized protein n=1 Tax=Helicocarpus griseus UAMH5409 TaxID=1447875 RepID=A0A2B7XDX0_9EURO|nr:hypothetical protein AJ79_06417 [Helicocarpus griseus UAMH5409]
MTLISAGMFMGEISNSANERLRASVFGTSNAHLVLGAIKEVEDSALALVPEQRKRQAALIILIGDVELLKPAQGTGEAEA